jgi:spermidine synthase
MPYGPQWTLAVTEGGRDVSARFEELDWQETPIGAVSLRRRRDPAREIDVYEVKLDDDFLMSSLFPVAEIELARLALAELAGDDLDVVVGGLGLGYTARTVLADPRVGSLTVVEALDAVIDWHRRELLPEAAALTTDPRNRFVNGDFFALVAAGELPDAGTGRGVDAVVVDIDHSPSHLLHPAHAAFYRTDGLRRLAGQLAPGGVFALWSNDPPEPEFMRTLNEVFTGVRAEVVRFANPLQDREATNTVYLARSS